MLSFLVRGYVREDILERIVEFQIDLVQLVISCIVGR